MGSDALARRLVRWRGGDPRRRDAERPRHERPRRGGARCHIAAPRVGPDDMSDEEATLIVTSGTAMYGLDVMGGIIAGEAVGIPGRGPTGLWGAGVAKG